MRESSRDRWPRGRPLVPCRLRRAWWRCNLMVWGVSMRLSLRLALGLLVAACGSNGGGGGSGSAGSDGGIPPASDVGAPDAGSPDAGPAPLGGGDWLQYRNSPLGGTSENPGIFAAGAAASVAPLWSIPADRFGVSGSYYYYSQPLIAGDTVYFATAFGQAGGGKV